MVFSRVIIVARFVSVSDWLGGEAQSDVFALRMLFRLDMRLSSPRFSSDEECTSTEKAPRLKMSISFRLSRVSRSLGFGLRLGAEGVSINRLLDEMSCLLSCADSSFEFRLSHKLFLSSLEQLCFILKCSKFVPSKSWLISAVFPDGADFCSQLSGEFTFMETKFELKV